MEEWMQHSRKVARSRATRRRDAVEEKNAQRGVVGDGDLQNIKKIILKLKLKNI